MKTKQSKTFRLSKSVIKQLTHMSEVMNKSQADVLESAFLGYEEGYYNGTQYIWASSLFDMTEVDDSNPEVIENIKHLKHYRHLQDIESLLGDGERMSTVGYELFSVCNGLFIELDRHYGVVHLVDDKAPPKTNFDKAKDTYAQASQIAEMAKALTAEHDISFEQALKVIEVTQMS